MSEIKKQILEHDRAFDLEYESIILYTLHTEFGFGAKRLRRFWEARDKAHEEMRERYEFEEHSERAWLARRKLKDELGIDIEKWYNEKPKKQ